MVRRESLGRRAFRVDQAYRVLLPEVVAVPVDRPRPAPEGHSRRLGLWERPDQLER